MPAQAKLQSNSVESFLAIYAAAMARVNGCEGRLSTQEQLAAALVHSHHGWLEDMGYTEAQALGSLEEGWRDLIPLVEGLLEYHSLI